MSRLAGGLAPFAPVFHWILDLNPSPHAIALYAHLHRRSDWQTGSVEISMQELATALRFAKRDSVRPYLDELVELGALEINEQRDATTGGRVANEYVLNLTPARSTGQGAARSTGQAPARSTGQLPISPDASTDEVASLPGLEPPSMQKATRPRGEHRPDVEAISALLVEQLSDLGITARVDANCRRAIGRLLDRPDVDTAELEHVVRWSFSEDCWWRGKLTTVSRWAAKFEDLRARMRTTGPATVAVPEPASVAGDWDPYEEFGAKEDREIRFLARGVDPAVWYRPGIDRVRLWEGVLALPQQFTRDETAGRLLGRYRDPWAFGVGSFRDAAPDWIEVPV